MRQGESLMPERQVLGKERSIKGIFEFQRVESIDRRGSFLKLFDQDVLSGFGWSPRTHQVNFSRTELAGSVRGMHAQMGSVPEFKLVTCVRGVAFDVCIDLRKGSPTFLQWEAVELSEGNAVSLLIPPGCAHGFQTLSDDTHLVYFHSAPYEPDEEIGINPFDPAIGISWPRELAEISRRDSDHPLLQSDFEGFEI